MKLIVHPRIRAKHPELSEEDVRTAFNGMFKHVHRLDGDLVGVGMDGKRRLVEVVARCVDDTIIVYHAFTPPTQKVMRELGMLR
ncbi:hypothetical protein GMI69_01910 [Eggerthellaceae bacterium zg-887]|uniref:hypothetical protein n=1 Tax=Xiamenia xianingshaonis TaxID=2682776 RepID=UPI00140DCE85|nr:hypothetical protein [Xiamenia xianingshaonis]NHM15428.1 hypothetical protein [Xiamenia xianingshaonis]